MEERELCVHSWREMKGKKRKVEDGEENVWRREKSETVNVKFIGGNR